MRNWMLALCLSGAAVSLALPAHADVITNADIIKLLDAGMSEQVILQAIATGTAKFSTSADALIKLKNKGASPAILQAVMNPKSLQAAPPSGNATVTSAPNQNNKQAATGGKLNPEEILVMVDGKETPMQYILPQLRTAARAFGLGGIASYAVLQGEKAARRLPGGSVEFIVSVPKNVQAVGYLNIANFAVRNNGNREVLIGGGYMSYSSGISKDRVVPIKTEALADQSRARDGFILYKISPEKTLSSGEYAFVLYTQEVRTAGFFATAANSYFDFGVD